MTAQTKQLWQELLDQHDRWILWFPVLMAMGIGLYFSLGDEPTAFLGLFLAGGFLCVSIYFYRIKKIFIPAIAFFLIALGFTAAEMRTHLVAAPMLQQKTPPIEIRGTIDKIENLESARRVTLRYLEYLSDWRTKDQLPQKVRIKLKTSDMEKSLTVGSKIEARVMLLPLSPPVMPGAYDFQRHLFFMGIGATGFALNEIKLIEEAQKNTFFENLRTALRNNIHEHIADKDAAGMTTALLYGEDQSISKETYEDMRKAGLAHLIAISGLQVTLVTGFLFFVVRYFLASIPYIALRYPIKKITAFIAMLGALFYMQLIGDNNIPAARAVIMAVVAMAAIMLDRDPFTLRLVAFAAAAVLLFLPESLLSPSFQLSFAAMVGLISFYEVTRDWWLRQGIEARWYKKFFLYILGSMAMTVVATISTAPFALYHFLSTPLLTGVLANLVAVPLSSFVTMPAAVIGAFLIPFGLEGIPFQIAGFSVRVILDVAARLANWPLSVFSMNAWGVEALALIAFGALWIAIWKGYIRLAGILPTLMAFFLIAGTPRADILISANGKLYAVRDSENKLIVSSKTAEKFVRDHWVKREGAAGSNFFVRGREEAISCDALACIYRAKGKTVSFVKLANALETDCEAADVIIAPFFRVDRKFCAAPDIVIDKTDLKKRGAHAVYFEPSGNMRIETVEVERGRRIWTSQ